MMTSTEKISAGKTFLGIELGSTRIKAVLIDSESYLPLASGSYDWENEHIDGVWTYSLENVKVGIQGCYTSLKQDVKANYNVTISKIACIGISAMMHGYLAFDKDGELLVPFRTWRNTTTSQAADELTELFGFNIPQRWSIAHLYQAILNDEEHISKINHITTLAGYVHYLLTDRTVLGIGDASGMFPIDSKTGSYDKPMLDKFNLLLETNKLEYSLESILPQILHAGDNAGSLTLNGAKLLDIDGDLSSGIILCPPEGDAGTGMVATNSIKMRTGNVSAGTSIFAMVVLEEALSKLYTEIDMVTTPDGKPVAMVHCNNCTSDINAWADLFMNFAKSLGVDITKGSVLDKMFALAEDGKADCGGLCSYNYFSGEPLTLLDEGRPMFVRYPDSEFSIENFMRTHLYSAVATLKLGMDILADQKNVKIDRLLGHGGYFKAKNAGQNILAAALNTDVSVMKTAAEGGAYGMAILAAYAVNNHQSLDAFLDNDVFLNCDIITVKPNPQDVDGFNRFIEIYKSGLAAQRAAVLNMKRI